MPPYDHPVWRYYARHTRSDTGGRSAGSLPRRWRTKLASMWRRSAPVPQCTAHISATSNPACWMTLPSGCATHGSIASPPLQRIAPDARPLSVHRYWESRVTVWLCTMAIRWPSYKGVIQQVSRWRVMHFGVLRWPIWYSWPLWPTWTRHRAHDVV